MSAPAITVPLKHAVSLDGIETSAIVLKRIKAKHLRDVDRETGVAQLLALVQRSSGWPPEAVEDIDAEDLGPIGEKLEVLMGKPKRG